MEEGRNRCVEETGGVIDRKVDCEIFTIEMLNVQMACVELFN
jgi:hypothetical protein